MLQRYVFLFKQANYPIFLSVNGANYRFFTPKHIKNSSYVKHFCDYFSLSHGFRFSLRDNVFSQRAQKAQRSAIL